MKNLFELFNKAVYDVHAAGIKIGRIDNIKIDKHLKNAWGLCSYSDKTCTGFVISISNRLLSDEITDEAAIETIIHELLHTCDGCMNHGAKWKKYADIINWKYKGKYHISIRTSENEKGIDFDKSKFKFVIQCNKCGEMTGFQKKCDTLKKIKNGEPAVICTLCKGKNFSIIKGKDLI